MASLPETPGTATNWWKNQTITPVAAVAIGVALLAVGALIIQSTYNFDSPLLYATIVVGSTFSALFFGVISLAERYMLRWHTAHKD